MKRTNVKPRSKQRKTEAGRDRTGKRRSIPRIWRRRRRRRQAAAIGVGGTNPKRYWIKKSLIERNGRLGPPTKRAVRHGSVPGRAVEFFLGISSLRSLAFTPNPIFVLNPQKKTRYNRFPNYQNRCKRDILAVLADVVPTWLV